MKVVVTGGGGFLGRALLGSLLESGARPEDVKVLSRNPSPRVEALGLRHEAGSVEDREGLVRCFQGAEVVFHLAGRVTRDRGADPSLYALHEGGTSAVIAAATEAGVRRVVYASSSSTLGCSRDPNQNPHEDSPAHDPLLDAWAYYGSKVAAEQVALKAGRQGDIQVICLNPTLLLGPGDHEVSSTNDIRDFMNGQVPCVPHGGFNYVDVRDVAAAFVTAVERGAPGERHLLGGENIAVQDFFQLLEEITGVKAPGMRPPGWMQSGAVRLAELGLGLFGRRPQVTSLTVEMAQVYWYAAGDRARELLDFHPRPGVETLRDTVADIRAESVGEP